MVVLVPDHCLSFYFGKPLREPNFLSIFFFFFVLRIISGPRVNFVQ